MTENGNQKLSNQGHEAHSNAEIEKLQHLSILTVEQAAKYLQLSPKTIWTHTRRGLLPVCRIGGLVRYRRQALDETLAKLETRSNVRK